MSWSLALRNGDLDNTGNGYATAAGGRKLVQDLRCCILEPMGLDSMHPSYGSILDGGLDTAGVYHQGVIGAVNDDSAGLLVSSELQRVITMYQRQQLTRNQNDLAVYGRSTLTADEALMGLGNISIQQVMDRILIDATLNTGVGGVPLAQAVGS